MLVDEKDKTQVSGRLQILNKKTKNQTKTHFPQAVFEHKIYRASLSKIDKEIVQCLWFQIPPCTC